MPEFQFQAKDGNGQSHQGKLESRERREVLQELRSRGWVPISVTETSATPEKKSKSAKTPIGIGNGKLSLRALLQFSTDLRDLLAAGMTLGSAIKKLSQQSGNLQRTAVLTQVHEDIVQGLSLSDSLKKYPKSFPEFYVSLIQAGEASGQLQDALQNAVRHYERAAEAREQVVGALVYPLLVAFFGFLVIIFCLVYVIPKFTQIFSDMDQILPLPTRILIVLSNSLIHYGWIFLVLGALIIIGFGRWRKTEKGRMTWHRFQLHVPIFQELIRSAAYANFARTLSNLLVNGVPVLTALDIVKKTANNAVLEKEIGKLKLRVTDGSSLSVPLSESGVFPDLFTDMLSVGEEAGQVPRSLAQIARRYDDELTRSIKRVTTVIEPLLMVLIAAGVGFVAISMLLPLFQLTQGLQ
ncbi:type II secretion system F family protein [Kiritimatiellaeota bacterium B1221]|nr:type II secretion system F family protein [Kiritimatiellaeota bacterium B1221]